MKRISLLILLLLLCRLTIEACTAVIISGRVTPDGRPVLWKHRDSDNFQNDVRCFNDGKYRSMGLVNSDDKEGKAIWSGYNSAGFAIINTASYNLIAMDTLKFKDQEGIIMRQALQVCASVDEFEEFLKNRPKPLGVEANFGVIDASGGAAWFEVDNFTWKKLDVNDPALAPMGYMVHTNFSFTGDPRRGKGQIRFKTAEDLFFEAAQQNNLTVRFILQDVSRSLWHSLTGTDLRSLPVKADEQRFVPFVDFIPRYTSTASVAIQGVRPGENPDFTTMWTVLGFPLTSVVFPLWLCDEPDQPGLVSLNGQQVAPLCDKSLKLKGLVFPVKQSYGEGYIDLPVLYNNQGSGILQKLKPLEDTVFEWSLKKLDTWRKNEKGFRKEIPGFYQELNDLITSKYNLLFGI